MWDLSGYFSRMLEKKEILDIELVKLNPTWTNKRIGNVRICKRLDRFLVSEDIMENHF